MLKLSKKPLQKKDDTFKDPVYDFKAIENKWRKYWEKNKIFKFNFDEQRPLYIVDTPPPYVSADHLHAGHIMSYAQAEFIVRYKRMRGYNVFYPMGFDDNGLPTERFVEKKYKINKKKTTKSEFIKICLKETKEGSKTYRDLWNALGISVDWSKTYSTIGTLATKISQWSLIDIYEKGGLYRSELPILWCPTCGTAIAQADLEDEERKSTMNFIHFAIKGEKYLVATTRPELLPACVALYVNPKDQRFRSLIKEKAQVPLFGQKVPVKFSTKVSMERGTGLMMVCTWGDQEDLEKWRIDKLESRPLFTQDGRLNHLGKEFQGLKIEEARVKILAKLEKEGLLFKKEKISHTVNVHERCSTPAELILSKQWFIKVVDLKKKWLEIGEKMHWFPKSMEKNYKNWVNALKWDWCITRQRYFGVPMPLWYCQKCEKPIFARKKDLPVNPLEDKPPFKQCPHCNHNHIIADNDVMDTWATSSCTPFLLREMIREELLLKNKKDVLKSEKLKTLAKNCPTFPSFDFSKNALLKKLFPTSLRPNAFEIIRTWDFYSIIKGYYNFSQIPFSNIMISGHGLDEHGRKISKRLGNYTPSNQLLNEYGADAIRYWATGASLGQNLRFNLKEIKKGKRSSIKLWNVFRFLAINQATSELKNKLTFKKNDQLEDMDVWIIKELNQTIKKVTNLFENYAYAQAKQEIDAFFWSKFADYYIEMVKYRLQEKSQAASKKNAKKTLLIVFLNLLKLYAPILPFITEELFSSLFRKKKEGKPKLLSIHLEKWPSSLKIFQAINKADFDKVIMAIEEIRKYKSLNKISLGTEIENIDLKTQVNLKKYKLLIKTVARVKNISFSD